MLLIDRVSAGYNRLPIIRDVSVRVEAGSIVAVIGPNGSGKSTLAKTIVGKLKPMSGRVTVGETDVTGWPTHRIVRRGVGYVPQTANVFVSLTVRENLEMGAYIYSGSVGARIRTLINEFPELSVSEGKRAGDLSGGQRNLLGVARALMADPRVLIVDEPTAGLAPVNSGLIWRQLARIAHAGAAVLVVEQRVDAALEHSDRCYVMVAGRCVMDGTASEIRRENLDQVFLGRGAGESNQYSPGEPAKPVSGGFGNLPGAR